MMMMMMMIIIIIIITRQWKNKVRIAGSLSLWVVESSSGKELVVANFGGFGWFRVVSG